MKQAKYTSIYVILTMVYAIFLSTSLVLALAKILGITSFWILQVINSALLLIIPFSVVLALGMFDIKTCIPFKKISIKNMIYIYLISIFIQPLFSFISSITSIFQENEISDVIVEFTKIQYWQTLLTVAVMPALIEEFIFRGIILTGYNGVNPWVGIITSSFFFGAIHLNITQLFYAIVAGVFFAFLVKTTGSIWSSVWSHFILNGTQISLAYLLYNAIPEQLHETMLETSTGDSISVVISSGFLFLVSLPFLILSLKIFKNANDKDKE